MINPVAQRRTAARSGRLVTASLALLALATVAAIGTSSRITRAANCGGVTPCSCGDTVTSNYTLTGDLSCSGAGLIVGANGITIDGGGFTLTGNRTGNGLYADSWGNLTVTNLNVTNFSIGINLSSINTSTIQNVTASGNRSYGMYVSVSPTSTISNVTASRNNNGIFLDFSNNATLTGNVTNGNIGAGITLSYVASSTLTGNVADGNARGIAMDTSSSSTLASNAMAGNTENLYITGSYNHTIGTTNTVESKPVYYLYQASNATYDGNAVGGIGMFWCISCTNVSVLNATMAANAYAGVLLDGSTGSTVSNVTTQRGTYGVYLNNSDSNTLSGSTVLSARNGIYLASSDSNSISGNTVYDSSVDLVDDGSNTFASNQFLHNSVSRMLTFVDTSTRLKSVGDTVSFDASLFNPTGGSCSSCTYQVTTSPAEAVSSSQVGNQVTGSFVATRSGMYSLVLTAAYGGTNTTTRRVLYWVGDTVPQTTRYYFRGANAGNGQPAGTDAQALLSTAPTSSIETWECGSWIQNSPDEIPQYAMSNLVGIDTSSWYKQAAGAGAYIGIQRFATYASNVDTSLSVPVAASYTYINRNFSSLGYGMDYGSSWYRLAVKLKGSTPSWTTFPDGSSSQPSYADFTYRRSVTAAVQSSSNSSIIVRSATLDASGTASVTLENPIFTPTTTVLALGGFNSPFVGLATTITSASTTSFTSPAVSSGTPVTVSSLPLATTPSTGSVTVSVTGWNGAPNYRKEWTETSDDGPTVSHVVGDLAPGTSYDVYYRRTGSPRMLLATAAADGSGQLSFNYDQGFSTVTFEVEATPTQATGSSGAPLPTGNVGGGSGAPGGSAVGVLPDGTARVSVAVASSSLALHLVAHPTATLPVAPVDGGATILPGLAFTVTATDGLLPVAELGTPVNLAVRYRVDRLGGLAEASLGLYRYDSGVAAWRAIGGLVDSIAHEVSASIDRLGIVAVGGFPYGSAPAASVPPVPAAVATPGVSIEAATPIDPAVAHAPLPQVTATFRRWLTYSSRGLEVRKLQAVLRRLGFFRFRSNTGYFGPITRAALIRFQQANGLPPVGQVGPLTRAILNALPQ